MRSRLVDQWDFVAKRAIQSSFHRLVTRRPFFLLFSPPLPPTRVERRKGSSIPLGTANWIEPRRIGLLVTKASTPPTRMIVQSLKDFLEEQLPDWRLLRGSNSNASAPDCISSWNRSSPLPTPSSQEGWIDRIDLDRSRLSSDPTSLATLSPVIRWFPRWSRQEATTFRGWLRGGISLTFRAFPAHFRPSSRGDSYALRMPWKIEREC